MGNQKGLGDAYGKTRKKRETGILLQRSGPCRFVCEVRKVNPQEQLARTSWLVADDAVQSGYGKSGIPSSFRNALCFSVAFLIALSIPTNSP